MNRFGPIEPPAVVVVGSVAMRSALGALLVSWGWTVLAMVDDDLAGVTLARRFGADLLVVDGSGHGVFGDLDLARDGLDRCAVVRVVDRPQDLAAGPGAVLAGVPPEQLRRTMVRALARVAPGATDHLEAVDA